ncbi:MAG TPA: hypothetical protein VI542_32735 [Candidatus Tectomicrobia bacterium]
MAEEFNTDDFRKTVNELHGAMQNGVDHKELLTQCLRACFEIPEMSTFLRFRGPSGSDAISRIPCKSAQLIFTEVTLPTVIGIFKTPSKLDFVHLSQFASQLIGNEIPCSLPPKGWPCSPCRSPLAVPLASLHPSFLDPCGSM